MKQTGVQYLHAVKSCARKTFCHCATNEIIIGDSTLKEALLPSHVLLLLLYKAQPPQRAEPER